MVAVLFVQGRRRFAAARLRAGRGSLRRGAPSPTLLGEARQHPGDPRDRRLHQPEQLSSSTSLVGIDASDFTPSASSALPA
jgi:hypothetical protein